VYFNLRSEKEGLNADVLFREMGELVEKDSSHYAPLMDDETQTDWGAPKMDTV
jgi:hypothetical protein